MCIRDRRLARVGPQPQPGSRGPRPRAPRPSRPARRPEPPRWWRRGHAPGRTAHARRLVESSPRPGGPAARAVEVPAPEAPAPEVPAPEAQAPEAAPADKPKPKAAPRKKKADS